ncbi:hypothetical protein C7999DRAFT_41384 [Corynascus novoguineensis]|uniref:Protein kinase domain-containing protein n=1 Tax=Corynascus novoguineensis TaxID=1126955 RepID=A0AAN7HND6_9PEZI|nr:hypothetical protein C7999DRAFT_41384 [Corynascus novoguineensis]
MATLGTKPPHFMGIRDIGDGVAMTLVLIVQFNGVRFFIVAADPDDYGVGQALVPAGYQFNESIESKFLIELAKLAWGDFDLARVQASERLERQLASLAIDACLPTMQHLALSPIQAAQTLQDYYLHPQVYTLQILTEVIKASQVILVRCLQGYVWRVTVDREDLVYKSLINVFEGHIGDELATYLKLRSASIKWKVPKLKGIVQSDERVVGILLAYIPHKHHSLRSLLDGIERGTIAPEEATVSLRQKWATQIRDTLAGLHSLGILWSDIKTDNVLIDEDGDAVVIDFGGGDTVGWVDRDKYGTMEGEMQGLNKIMAALGVEPTSN